MTYKKKQTFEGSSKYFIAVEGRKHNISYGGGIVQKGVQGYTVKPKKGKMTKVEKEAVMSVLMCESGDYVSIASARNRAKDLDKEVRRERQRLKQIEFSRKKLRKLS